VVYERGMLSGQYKLDVEHVGCVVPRLPLPTLRIAHIACPTLALPVTIDIDMRESCCAFPYSALVLFPFVVPLYARSSNRAVASRVERNNWRDGVTA